MIQEHATKVRALQMKARSLNQLSDAEEKQLKEELAEMGEIVDKNNPDGVLLFKHFKEMQGLI